ncbi:FUSC family protein [Paraburkholderia tropica]|uniref:Fusaric acid resistance protein family protein n=1 Tax=Paraburkholderia tropica TaxID=92647 RepID=A0AAQ1JVH3_9BURK|nr:FUSC family protein [Paraburkholderia tropica]RQN35932.1 FUSC family protein [Paraburkholderia tropica]SEJ95379.1 Fusaric acid resistance protein family protein [Paraburkholderia tropica]
MNLSEPKSTHSAVPRRRVRSRVARVWRALTSPFYRYRNAALIHAIRVGLAMLTSILATTGINIPHGIWASVTLLVVIGGLQHHGNIRKKAAERALGTLLGALIGLTLIVVQAVTGSSWLTYSLMSIVAAVCSYYAIGKPGYVALLTAITMCIVAGHGDNLIDTGLWRTLNVMIGIVIALAFSFALPLHATYSWRYRLADSLRECARVYTQIVSGVHVDNDEHIEIFRRLNQRLVQLRSLMPSVAKEIDVPAARLEQIQRQHRAILSSLEMMATGLGRYEQQLVRVAFAGRSACVREALLATARALRFGGARHPEAAAKALRAPSLDSAQALAAEPSAPLAPDMQGPYWLGLRFEEQVAQLRSLLLETEPRWNIERAHLHRMV